MSDELELAKEAENETFYEVVKLTASGRSPQFIHSQTGIPPRKQREMNEEFRAYVRNDRYAFDRSKELVGYADQHFGHLINGFNEVIDEAEMANDPKLKKEALKEIANVEAMRIKFFQSAGLIGQQGIGDEIVEAERKIAQVVSILRETASKFPEAASFIRAELQKLNGQVAAKRVAGEE